MSKCEICKRKLIPLKNDFKGRKYHKKCYDKAGTRDFINDEERKACEDKVAIRFALLKEYMETTV